MRRKLSKAKKVTKLEEWRCREKRRRDGRIFIVDRKQVEETEKLLAEHHIRFWDLGELGEFENILISVPIR